MIMPTLVALCFLTGCAKGTWQTGNAVADVGLIAATQALEGELIGFSDQIAKGSDIKTAWVNSSGSALNALVLSTTTAIEPAVTAQVKQWVPPTPQWEIFAHNIGIAIGNYVAQHGNTNQALQFALQAGANILNSY